MFVKTQRMSIALLAILVAALFGSVCFADEGEDAIAGGVVIATKDANGVITAVQLASDIGDLNVELDATGLELGAMDGQNVEVTGVLTEKDGQKWIKVTSFEVPE
ncbi:MAG: hypothetical protein PHQ35_04585 [Phycisphaerae bacterium]|nr:hypothetical protein [Phycisphaerae bacterium]MDD5380206.1 hypothetical protein [Phycisphaerae bacterium]